MSTKKKAGTGCAIVGVGTAGCGEAQGFSDVFRTLTGVRRSASAGPEFRDSPAWIRPG